MTVEQKDIEQIRKLFADMQTKEDLLGLLNYTKPLVYGTAAIPFELKQLAWHANPSVNFYRYASFRIKKKSSGTRRIHVPVKGLKAIQRVLNVILQSIFEPHKAAAGFTKGRSIVDHARIHESSNYVYNIDLKDFFPSIDQARVWKCFQLKPFNLGMIPEENIPETDLLEEGTGSFLTDQGETVFFSVSKMGTVSLDRYKGDYVRYKKRWTKAKKSTSLIKRTSIADELEMIADAAIYISKQQKVEATFRRRKLADILAALCCTSMVVERLDVSGDFKKVRRNALPQGAPTSPIISNIVCQRLDFLLTGVAARFGLKYSRYADDITFSSMHNVYREGSEFLTELQRVIKSQHFHTNVKKTRLQKPGYRQEVTGLVVNEKVNVNQRYIKQLRMWLYYWEQYGHEKAAFIFSRQYLTDRAYRGGEVPPMERVIAGKLEYLKMVRGEGNKLYATLKKRFENVRSLEGPINDVLDAWEQHGVEKAMEIYYNTNR